MISKKIRGLKRGLLSKVTPRVILHRIIRASINLSSSIESSLVFKLAETKEEQNQALSLLHDAYVREGYMRPHPSGMRITPYHMLPTTITPIVKRGGRVIATISIIPRTKLGLPIEGICKINHLFEKKSQVIEISALAVDQSESGEHGKVLFPLMKYMYKCSVKLLKANYEFIAINPKMAPLYEALLLFKPLKIESKNHSYSFVNGAPVRPLGFCLDSGHASYEKVYQGVNDSRNLLKFFVSPDPSNFYLPNSLDEFVSPQSYSDQFSDLFCKKTRTLEGLSKREKMALSKVYVQNKEISKLIKVSHD